MDFELLTSEMRRLALEAGDRLLYIRSADAER